MSVRFVAVPMAAAVTLAGLLNAGHAQGSAFVGRVLSDSGIPLPGAEVVINGPQRAQRTNEQGEFRFTAIPAGTHIVGVRMPGFAPKVDTIEVADAGEVHREFRLSRIVATLPEVPVTATLLDRKLAEFHERRRLGVGRFLDSAEFANRRGTRTSDRLATLPGVVILRGRGSDAYVANNRDRRVGSGWCRANIWLDGVNLGTGYNVNELDPSIISAVEWYAGQATIPARFNVAPRPSASSTSGRPEPYCGVLVIWLR